MSVACICTFFSLIWSASTISRSHQLCLCVCQGLSDLFSLVVRLRRSCQRHQTWRIRRVGQPPCFKCKRLSICICFTKVGKLNKRPRFPYIGSHDVVRFKIKSGKIQVETRNFWWGNSKLWHCPHCGATLVTNQLEKVNIKEIWCFKFNPNLTLAHGKWKAFFPCLFINLCSITRSCSSRILVTNQVITVIWDLFSIFCILLWDATI